MCHDTPINARAEQRRTQAPHRRRGRPQVDRLRAESSRNYVSQSHPSPISLAVYLNAFLRSEEQSDGEEEKRKEKAAAPPQPGVASGSAATTLHTTEPALAVCRRQRTRFDERQNLCDEILSLARPSTDVCDQSHRIDGCFGVVPVMKSVCP